MLIISSGDFHDYDEEFPWIFQVTDEDEKILIETQIFATMACCGSSTGVIKVLSKKKNINKILLSIIKYLLKVCSKKCRTNYLILKIPRINQQTENLIQLNGWKVIDKTKKSLLITKFYK